MPPAGRAAGPADQIHDVSATAVSDRAGRVRRVHVTTIFTSRLTLAERGPDVTAQDKGDTAEHLAGIGRRLAAAVDYAAVDLDVGDDFSSWFQCNRPGAGAPPSALQGLRRSAHCPGQDQDRDPALSQALRRQQGPPMPVNSAAVIRASAFKHASILTP